MNQDKFDLRFDRIFKAGFAAMLIGMGLAVFVGAPAFALFGTVAPLIAAAALGVAGAIVCVANFAHDIFFNPRMR